MTKIRLVQIVNGKYGIQKKKNFFSECIFIEITGNIKPDYCYEWYTQPGIGLYCLVDTLEEANIAMENVINKTKEQKIKPYKVAKVIRTVKV